MLAHRGWGAGAAGWCGAGGGCVLTVLLVVPGGDCGAGGGRLPPSDVVERV